MGDEEYLKLLCDEPLLTASEAAVALGLTMPYLAADDEGDDLGGVVATASAY